MLHLPTGKPELRTWLIYAGALALAVGIGLAVTGMLFPQAVPLQSGTEGTASVIARFLAGGMIGGGLYISHRHTTAAKDSRRRRPFRRLRSRITFVLSLMLGMLLFYPLYVTALCRYLQTRR